jgi:hypothetical protein
MSANSMLLTGAELLKKAVTEFSRKKHLDEEKTKVPEPQRSREDVIKEFSCAHLLFFRLCCQVKD